MLLFSYVLLTKKRMRKRFFHERVCSCSPVRGVQYMQPDLLRAVVNREIHPIRCASTCGRKACKAMTLGDLGAEAGHPQWAKHLWAFGIEQIHDKDYADWLGVWFNPDYVCLQDVISNGWCELLGRRIDDIDRRYGFNNPQGRNCWEYWAGDGWYESFRYEKFDVDSDYWRDYFLTMRREAMQEQATQRLFREGQGELPPQAQDFFYYWEDFDPTEQDLYFKIDDWDFECSSSG